MPPQRNDSQLEVISLRASAQQKSTNEFPQTLESPARTAGGRGFGPAEARLQDARPTDTQKTAGLKQEPWTPKPEIARKDLRVLPADSSPH